MRTSNNVCEYVKPTVQRRVKYVSCLRDIRFQERSHVGYDCPREFVRSFDPISISDLKIAQNNLYLGLVRHPERLLLLAERSEVHCLDKQNRTWNQIR